MTNLNPTGAGVETKVVASSGYGFLTLVITWILTNYVFHGHIPADLQTLLPGFVAMAAGSAAGWLSHHTPRMDETVTAVTQVLAAQQQAAQPAAPAAPQGPTGMAR